MASFFQTQEGIKDASAAAISPSIDMQSARHVVKDLATMTEIYNEIFKSSISAGATQLALVGGFPQAAAPGVSQIAPR